MARRATSAPPFLRLRASCLSPLLLTCEHATSRLPHGHPRPSRAERDALASHWGWDIGAWALARSLSRRLGAGAIGGRWSRLLIDLNRRVDDPTLIRERAGELPLRWNRGLAAREVERRVLDYHAPYHQEVDRLILRRLVRGVRPLLLAVHSFTEEYEGSVRRFDAGVLYERHRALAGRLGRGLREAGLSVRYNEPYSGMAGMMYAADRHGSHHRLPCLELEVRQDLIARPAGVERLARAVAGALRPLLRGPGAAGGHGA